MRILILFIILTGIFLPLSSAVSSVPLTEQEKEWLEANKGNISIGIKKNIPIYSETDKNGNFVGLIPDYMNLLEQKLNFKFQYHLTETWPDAIDDFYKGKIDLIPILNHSEHYKNKYLVTSVYAQAPKSIVSKNKAIDEQSLETNNNLRIVLTKGMFVDRQIKQRYPDCTIFYRNTIHASILAVAFDAADITFINTSIASHILTELDLTNLYLSPIKGFEGKYRFGVHIDQPMLQSILDKGISLITEEDKQKIYDKWIKLESDPFYRNNTFWLITLSFISVVLLLLQGIWYWNTKLKEAVAHKTGDLAEQTRMLKQEEKILYETERALIKQKAYLNTLFDAIPDIVWVKDLDGNYINYNHAFAILLDLDSNSFHIKGGDLVIEKDVLDALHREDQEIIQNPAGYILQFQETYYTKTGRSLRLDTIKTGIHDKDGNCIAVLGVARDITKHQEKQTEIIQLKEQIESILQNIKGFIFSGEITNGKVIRRYNSSYIQDLTGYAQEDYIEGEESLYLRAVHPDDLDLLTRKLNSTFSTKLPLESKHRLVHLNGSVSWVHGKGVIRHDQNTGKTFLEGLVIDITELHEIEKRLQQARKLETVGMLASGIAHDFNNNLGGILGYAEILQEDMKRKNYPESFLKRLNYVLMGTKRADELVSQILEFSKVETTRLRPFRANTVIKEVTKLLEAISPDSIKVSYHMGYQSYILADSTKFHQLIMNLGTNALYAMQDNGGNLTITTERQSFGQKEVKNNIIPGTYLKLTIADTGPGMDEEILQKIMQPFFTTKPQGEGTGMGLWVVHQIVEEFKGFLTVESEVGAGSSFSIYLPAHGEQQIESETNEKTSNLEKYAGTETILFVDDEKTLIDIAELILTRYGYRVKTYHSPVSALTDFTANPDQYDLVVTDLNMPEISGDVLQAKFSEIRPDIKTILTTGFQKDIVKEELFDRILKKPVSITILLQNVREVLG